MNLKSFFVDRPDNSSAQDHSIIFQNKFNDVRIFSSNFTGRKHHYLILSKKCDYFISRGLGDIQC